LGDGTFGRVLEVKNDERYYAMKVWLFGLSSVSELLIGMSNLPKLRLKSYGIYKIKIKKVNIKLLNSTLPLKDMRTILWFLKGYAKYNH
jgi:hypothetical protein